MVITGAPCCHVLSNADDGPSFVSIVQVFFDGGEGCPLLGVLVERAAGVVNEVPSVEGTTIKIDLLCVDIEVLRIRFLLDPAPEPGPLTKELELLGTGSLLESDPPMESALFWVCTSLILIQEAPSV